MKRIAPNLDFMIWRPILADPPLCTLRDFKTWITLPDLMDMHEALDLKTAAAEKAARHRERTS